MRKPSTLGGLLLLTTAMWAPAVLAQVAPQAPNPPDAQAVEEVAEQDTAAGEQVDISIPGVEMGEEIVVIGNNIPDTIRATPQVVSVLSTEDIARTGDGDIAGALQRVTGLSVVGNGFVYVRGLGDRYSLALLNGLALPSPEPLRRVVPLDIFPTSILASALVQKSYSVNYPGEFGGGVINLTTTALPEESFLSVGAGISGDTETTGNLGYTYYGSDTDWSGFDDGTRSIPTIFRNALDSGALINEGATFSRRDIQDIAASLVNAPTTLLQKNDNIPANFAADISAGTSWDAGTGLRLGVIASAGFSNSWKTRDAIQQAGGLDTIASDFRTVRTDNRIVVNGLLGLGAELGEHKLRWTNLYIRDTLKQGRLSEGYSLSVGDPNPELPPQLIRQGTAWFERQLINSQVVGEFDFGDFGVDVRAGYANSQRESPYERNFSYAYSSEVDDYVNNLTATGQTATISFSDLNEDVYNGGIDFSYRIPASPLTLSAGYAYLDTQRDSMRRDFAYRPANSLGLAVSQTRPDYLLSDFNIYTYDILLVETSALAGAAAYEADLTVHGAYGQATAELTDGLRLTGGVRYEDGRQSVEQVDLFNQGGIVQPPALENEYWLPAATLTWNFAPDMQVRFNASKTLARPQFRELAPQVYLDTESDRQFVGNPFLQDSELLNAEARYEWYFARDQRFSLAGFFKRIENPIEAVAAFAGGGTLQTTFANAPQADLYGFEVELQKYFPFDAMFGDPFLSPRRAVVIANYTFSDSSLSVDEDDQTILNDNRGLRSASEVFGDGDPLTGQSRHLANLQLGLEHADRLSQQTLLLTYASKRVTNRGPVLGQIRQADIVEEPGLRLDFVAREGVRLLGADLELKFEARNLTGEDFEEYQEDSIRIITNQYDLGTSFSLGIGAKF